MVAKLDGQIAFSVHKKQGFNFHRTSFLKQMAMWNLGKLTRSQLLLKAGILFFCVEIGYFMHSRVITACMFCSFHVL